MTDPPTAVVEMEPNASRGAIRNALLDTSTEEYVAVMDAGDAQIGRTLTHLRGFLEAHPDVGVALCPATHGSDTLVNVLVPEQRRLDSRAYLSRGFLARRGTLEALGGFSEDPDRDDLVDHDFWWSLTHSGGRTGLVRRIGFALWPRLSPR
jgi:hypothetical protein